MIEEQKGNIIIYQSGDGISKIDVLLEDENVWLSQQQMAELYQSSRTNVVEHIKNIYQEGELDKNATCRKFRQLRLEGNRKVQREIPFYNLDMIISLGYRIKSNIATKFRIWATERLKEYIIKGFTMDDDRLKSLGGGNYWKELLDRIRNIRSSEKVMYRQVLDLYATAIDYDSKSEESLTFFKIVQNKLHYAAHGKTANEVIFLRVDSNKPFAGLTNFKGDHPTQAEAMIAKNFLAEKELKVLNNLVAAYFDLAELNAIEEREMRMADYVNELNTILASAGRKVLENAGGISSKQAKEKAKQEYKKHKAKTLSSVENAYLKTITALEHKAKKESRKK
ncbi:MAG: virulence RhuM family protein [Flavobacteriaceae bacterium]|nr:virulence RhuM family protein [Flavobacteriaceae bacterium]